MVRRWLRGIDESPFRPALPPPDRSHSCTKFALAVSTAIHTPVMCQSPLHSLLAIVMHVSDRRTVETWGPLSHRERPICDSQATVGDYGFGALANHSWPISPSLHCDTCRTSPYVHTPERLAGISVLTIPALLVRDGRYLLFLPSPKCGRRLTRSWQ